MVFDWTLDTHGLRVCHFPSLKALRDGSLFVRTGDWEMFTAAYCSVETRDMFIKDLATWIDATDTGRPLTDLYEVDTGS